MLNSKVILIISILFSLFTQLKSQQSYSVTYVANEGFLIETNKHKILIDALFGGVNGDWCEEPNDSIAGLMIKGAAPFNKIDVVLITHYHLDHFTSRMVLDFLLRNKKSILVCPNQIKEILKENPDSYSILERVKAIESNTHIDTLVSVGEIKIRAVRLRHGSYFQTDSTTGKTYDIHEEVENLGYLIESDQSRFLHTGDCGYKNKKQFEEYNLFNEKIDCAFFSRTFLKPEGMDIINGFSDLKNVVLMHLEPVKKEYYNALIKDIPQFFIFNSPLEKRIYSE